jgi:gamma-glutamyltranspeptidase / glutathione hydrolase
VTAGTRGELAVMAEQCTGRGPGGVVAAAAPAAAVAGLAALADGGNAYDAAVAAALAECVLLPPKCGLGGDLIALVVEPGAGEPEALLAIGGAGAGLAAAVEAAGRLDDTGPLSVGVPAAPVGYAALAGRGRLSPHRLASDAIRLARNGFAWSAICTTLAEESAALVARQHGPTVYYPEGRPIAPGAVVRLPGLAELLEAWADEPDALWAGPAGRAVAERVRASGGVLTVDDLAAARAEWAPCPHVDTAGGRVWATPAPTHGPALLEAARDLPAAPVTPDEVYRRVLRAVAWRRDRLADPSGTSMVTAVDDEGRVVLVVHSNSYPRFGSGLIVDRYDLILNNRAGRASTAEPGHPNAPVAGRRPATTLHAWAVGPARRRGTGRATPGGANHCRGTPSCWPRSSAASATPACSSRLHGGSGCRPTTGWSSRPASTRSGTRPWSLPPPAPGTRPVGRCARPNRWRRSPLPAKRASRPPIPAPWGPRSAGEGRAGQPVRRRPTARSASGHNAVTAITGRRPTTDAAPPMAAPARAPAPICTARNVPSTEPCRPKDSKASTLASGNSPLVVAANRAPETAAAAGQGSRAHADPVTARTTPAAAAVAGAPSRSAP